MASVTIRDVAREAAVSVASASRALNGHANVRPALRSRVEAAAALLRYVPHHGARSLSLARTGAIGVVLPDLHGEFFSEVLRGLDREASERGLQLLLSNMHADAHRAIEALHSLRGRVDGLVVMAPQVDPDRLLAHLPLVTPTVLVNCAPHHETRAELRVDNLAGAEALVEHLVATGRRRIVHVAGPEGNIDADERVRGYHAVLARHGLPARVIAGTFKEDAGVAAAEAMLADPLGFDAVFAANDMMAIGVMVTLRRAGLVIPSDVAIGGFDDIPLARLISPALTTMRADIAAVGARAVARLAALIAGENDGGIELRTPELVVRETTAP